MFENKINIENRENLRIKAEEILEKYKSEGYKYIVYDSMNEKVFPSIELPELNDENKNRIVSVCIEEMNDEQKESAMQLLFLDLDKSQKL